VRMEADAVVLMLKARGSASSEWKSAEQRVPLVWTRCHLGGARPWFRCSASVGGRPCGRRVAKLYLRAAAIFACRDCCGLAYASQQEIPRYRAISRVQKARMRLGGSARRGRAAADDDPGGGSDYCHRNHGTCADGREFPSRTRFRRLARADATAEIDRRKAEARRTIRRLLILGASAVIRQAGRRAALAGSWLAQMLFRKPKMLVTVALANKMARVVWAMMISGEVYRQAA
jgi:hypothetical protein